MWRVEICLLFQTNLLHNQSINLSSFSFMWEKAMYNYIDIKAKRSDSIHLVEPKCSTTSPLNHGNFFGPRLYNKIIEKFSDLQNNSISKLRKQLNILHREKATGCYRTYLVPGKTAALVPEFAEKTCLRQNCSLGSCVCSEKPALGNNTLITQIYKIFAEWKLLIFSDSLPDGSS